MEKENLTVTKLNSMCFVLCRQYTTCGPALLSHLFLNWHQREALGAQGIAAVWLQRHGATHLSIQPGLGIQCQSEICLTPIRVVPWPGFWRWSCKVVYKGKGVYTRAQLSSPVCIVGQSFELPVLHFAKRPGYLQGEVRLDDRWKSLPTEIVYSILCRCKFNFRKRTVLRRQDLSLFHFPSPRLQIWGSLADKILLPNSPFCFPLPFCPL